MDERARPLIHTCSPLSTSLIISYVSPHSLQLYHL